MANNLIKEPATGIDKPIQMVQSILYGKLRCLWPDALAVDNAYEAYGRAYRLQYQDKNNTIAYRPEAYVICGEFNDLLLDDTKILQSFFVVGDGIPNDMGNVIKAPVGLIVMADTAALVNKPFRADEEVRNSIYGIMNNIGWGFNPTGIVTGNDKVFAEFSGSYLKDGLFARDMKYHFFRINMTLTYYPEQVH